MMYIKFVYIVLGTITFRGHIQPSTVPNFGDMAPNAKLRSPKIFGDIAPALFLCSCRPIFILVLPLVA